MSAPPRLLALTAALAAAVAAAAEAQQPPPGCAAAAALLGADAERAALVRDTTFSDPLTNRSHRGCALTLETTWGRTAAALHLADRLREGLAVLGWREDLRYTADGPDGTAFAMRRGSEVCFVAARWNGGDDSDPMNVPPDHYALTLRCTTTD